jgi:hypothetical protein
MSAPRWDDPQTALKTVYFLGAGATRADYPEVPLMGDLLHEIIQTGSAHDLLLAFLEDIFGSQCHDTDADIALRPRMDDVFTLIDASLSGRAPSPDGKSREELAEVRRHLIAAIGRVIARTVGVGRGQTATRFARALPEHSSTILSTNYDLVMDGALLERRPTGNVNYGVSVRDAVYRQDGQREGRFDEMHHYRAIPDSQKIIRRGGIPLLKLNGSLNWLYCPRCDELDVTLRQSTGALPILDVPELGRCSQERCTSPYESVLVGPSLEQRYEHRVLRDTWARAERALRQADALVVIGYSMPDADFLVRALIARNFGHRSDAVTVVTAARSLFDNHLLEQRYRRLLAHCRFEVDGFAGYVDRMSWSARTTGDLIEEA